MTRPLYLNAVSSTPETCTDESLRALLRGHQIDPRRMSRFTRLALAALLPALAQAAPARHLVLAAPSGSPHKLRHSLDSLNREHLPNLLDFNAALPNAALFACCKAAGISGSSLFCAVSAATLTQPLWLAANTVWRQGGSVWTGWAYEAPPSEGGAAEGALWWQLGDAPGADCLAVLRLGQEPAGEGGEETAAGAYWPQVRRLLCPPAETLPAGGSGGLFWRLSPP